MELLWSCDGVSTEEGEEIAEEKQGQSKRIARLNKRGTKDKANEKQGKVFFSLDILDV